MDDFRMSFSEDSETEDCPKLQLPNLSRNVAGEDEDLDDTESNTPTEPYDDTEHRGVEDEDKGTRDGPIVISSDDEDEDEGNPGTTVLATVELRRAKRTVALDPHVSS